MLVNSEHLRAWQLLHREGFVLDHRWEENNEVVGGGPDGTTMPTAYVLTDGDGAEVDVHVLGDDLAPLWITDRAFVAGALDASGTIDGLRVACMSARMQRLAHSGYDVPVEQQRDLRLLDEVDPRPPE